MSKEIKLSDDKGMASLKKMSAFFKVLGIKPPVINIPEAEPEIKKVEITVVEPKQLESGFKGVSVDRVIFDDILKEREGGKDE